MIGRGRRREERAGRWGALAPDSPLRGVDPRAKLAISLGASLAVMLPLDKVAVFLACYALFMAWARLLPVALRVLWRLKWVLLVLFAVDWWLISLELAVLVTLRIVLLSGAFAIVFATTTPEEFRLVLEWLRLPYRYAFSLGLAVQSIGLLGDEWRTIMEAQQARGAWQPVAGWRNLARNARDLVALAVPAVVMTARRAWAMTEAAYARGFDSPDRRPYRQLAMRRFDWVLLAAASLVIGLLLFWRW